MTTPDCRIRIATSEDAPCVAALATHVFMDTYATDGMRTDLAGEAFDGYSVGVFASLLASPHETAIHVAEADGHMLGFVEAGAAGTPPAPGADAGTEIRKLYVHPRFHRRGIGRALLDAVRRCARHDGLPLVWLTAWSGNANALGFYARLGFDDVGATVHEIDGHAYENRVLVERLR